MADTNAGSAKSTVVVVGDPDDQQQQKPTELENPAPTPVPIPDPMNACKICLKVFFIVVGIITVVVGLAMIIVAILTSISTKAYDADQSSRIAAMLLLAVSAAVSISTVIYGQVAILKLQFKPVYITTTVLIIVVIVQALITGIAIPVDDGDKAILVKSLTESFNQSRDPNSRHHKIWATTQEDLECCGLNSADDYRNNRLPLYFPPDVPISCCPSYDSKRSELVQEKDRALCKAKKIYYKRGCEDPVVTVFEESAQIVMGVSVLLICVEIVLLFIGAVMTNILYKKKKEENNETVEVKTLS